MTTTLYRLACVLLVCAVAAWARQARGGPQEAISGLPRTPREVWAVDLLKRLGNERPTGETVAMVVEWTLAEDRTDSAFERNNPLNTTQSSNAETVTINSDGVKGYESHSAGIDATVRTLTNGLYDGIVAALLANDPESAKRALWASDWASSHYSGGVGWPVYQMEETQVARVSSRCLPTSTGAISAHFHDTSSAYWSAQAHSEHNGTDYSGNQGDPVYAPFDLTVEDVGYYGDAARVGWYVQGRFQDGYLFYAGHLGTVAVRVGDQVPACAVIGTIGGVWHVHVKVASPDMPVPCEATGCYDFEEYFNGH